MKQLLIFTALLGLFSCSNTSTSPEKEAPEIIQSVSDTSTITCPICGYQKTEKLPTEYCLFKYTCDSCGNTLFPKEEDCCVFCSYGTHKCPSIQEKEL